MSEWLLRVEGVNLDNFVYDTQDLSTARGGGLLLLDAIGTVGEHFSDLSPISTGASSGLFLFHATDGQNLRNDVDEFLRKDPVLRHATFVVDVARVSESFHVDVETLIARNRWRQMFSPSLAVPRTEGTGEAVCPIDLVRPALEKTTLPDKAERQLVSRSVLTRRDYGREKKQKFYAGELAQLAREGGDDTHVLQVRSAIAVRDFAQHLEELTTDRHRGNLNRKMAVFYVDGNSFGAIQSGLERQKLSAWDSTLKRYRRTLLADLLAMFPADSGWQTEGEDGKWRFETLLWGGDELLWVVPAWKGWETLRFFYERARHWEFDGTKLRHAAGLVFCHHNAPIQRVVALAKTLAEKAKELNREENLFAYQVLESFDYVAGDLDDYRKTRVAVGESIEKLILRTDEMQPLDAAFETLRARFPRNKLHEIVLALTARRSPEGAHVAHEDLIRATVGDTFPDDESQRPLQSVLKFFGAGNTAWAHIAELWDYIPPPRPVAVSPKVTT